MNGINIEFTHTTNGTNRPTKKCTMRVDFSGSEAVLDGTLFILFDENLVLLLVHVALVLSVIYLAEIARRRVI